MLVPPARLRLACLPRLLPLAALLALVVCTTLPASARATPPDAVAGVSVALQLSGDERQARVTWAPGTDSDGTVASYVVERSATDIGPWVALPAIAAPDVELVVGNVTPGRTHWFRVTAIDDVAEQSVAGAPVALTVPRVPLAVALSVREQATALTQCGTLSRPCSRMSRAGLSLAGTIAPSVWGDDHVVRIERRYRKPGTSRYVRRATIVRRSTATGATGISLAARGALPAAGRWCYRVVVPATDTTNVAASAWRCVRWRPPVTIGWAGDIALGSRSDGLPPGNGRGVFSAVRPELRAPDLMIGNYEGTLSTGGTPRCSGGARCYIFQAPPRMAGGLRHAGFDVMNLANNHGLDMGVGARAQTVRALAKHGVGHTGLPGQITVRQVADTRVALVGFGWTNGTMLVSDIARVRSMVRRASRRADIVVVLHHSGTEGRGAAHVPRGTEPGRGNTRRFTATAIAAGADVVFGSGPHVVRGVEQRQRKLAFYSTGNFAGWNNFARGGLSSQSGIATVTLQYSGTTERGRYIGVRLVGPGRPVRDASIVRRVRMLSKSDFGSRGARIASNGVISIR